MAGRRDSGRLKLLGTGKNNLSGYTNTQALLTKALESEMTLYLSVYVIYMKENWDLCGFNSDTIFTFI